MTTVVWPNSKVWTGCEAWFSAPTVDIVQPDSPSARPKPAGRKYNGENLWNGHSSFSELWLQYIQAIKNIRNIKETRLNIPCKFAIGKKITPPYGMLDGASVQLCINCVIIEMITQNIAAVSNSEYWSEFWCIKINAYLLFSISIIYWFWGVYCEEGLVSSTKLCNSFRAIENT